MAGRYRDVGAENVRMGPLALFTLMAVICLAVLAVLAVSTANATLALSQRRAQATTELYLDETCAQAYLAALDGELAGGADAPAAQEAAAAAARRVGGELVTIGSEVDGEAFVATFDCGNGRQLGIRVRIGDDGRARVEEWRVATVQNDEPTMGELLGSS